MIGARDGRCMGWLGALLLLQFAPVLSGPRTYFLRDLTYIAQPWRSLASSCLQSGVFPLWDPYAYLGMPLAANAQSEVLYPLSLPFYFFSFPAALKVFHLLEYGLAGFLAYLWLRSKGGSRSGCAGAAAAYMLGGVLLARLEFLNLVAALALLPALGLFADSAAGLALVLSLGVLAGHPQTWAAGAAEMLVLACFLAPTGAGRRAGRWAAAAAAAALVCAAAWIPFLELFRLSRRAAGLGSSVTLALSLKPRELLGLVTALATPSDPAGARYAWWSAAYLGFAASAAALLGAARLGKSSLSFVAVAAAAAIFCLGDSTSVSTWLWLHVPALHWIRYPANFTFLIVLPVLPLIAAGFGARRYAPWLAFAIGLELLVYGAGIQPTAPDSYWRLKGPMVTFLQANADGQRFFLSPKASRTQAGHGSTLVGALTEIKERLQGLSFLPFRLSSVSGAGEPLVPAGSQEAVDYASSLPSKESAADSLAWLDARFLLTPEPGYGQTDASPRDPMPRTDARSPWIYRGTPLWSVFELPKAGQAFFLGPDADLAASFDALSAPPAGLQVARPRPDLEEARGDTGSGWLVVSRTLYPGWKAWVNGEPVPERGAFGVFPAYALPSGAWTLRARYEPSCFEWGLALSLAGLACAAVFSIRYLR